MKDYKKHKIKFNPFLEKLYQSDKAMIIYKVKDGYNIYTDFSKKIILNNLIAEKLLAIEIEKSGLETINASASAFLKGRKEQSMRQLLYFKEGYSKSIISENEKEHYFKMAGRTYDISHFSFPGGAFLDSINSALNANTVSYTHLTLPTKA